MNTIFLGVRVLDMVSQDGQPIKGLSMWFAEDGNNNCVGWIPFKVWIPDTDRNAFLSKIGYSLSDLAMMGLKRCDLSFGRKNRLQDMKFIK